MAIPSALFDYELLNLETFERRYYSRISAPFPHEPTREKFRIIRVDGMGEGLQALVKFAYGDIVFRFAGSVVTKQTLFSLQIEPGKYLDDPLVMGKVLHSCEPNMRCDMKTLTFHAIRNISSGEFLTMDYESTEDELFQPFLCYCGSSQCRGLIKGRKVQV